MLDREMEKYVELSANLKIPEGLTLEEEYALSEELRNFISKVTPKKLYKYRSCGRRNFEAFDNDELYFSSANGFNDPFDSLCYTSKLDFDINSINTLEDFKLNFPKIVSALCSSDKVSNELKDYIKAHEKMFIAQIEEYYIHDEDQDFIQDLKENISSLDIYTRDVFKNYKRSCCLSEDVKSTTMWAYYSASHSGYCLEYEANALVGVQNQKGVLDVALQTLGLPVLYSDTKYDALEYILESVIKKICDKINIVPPKLTDKFATNKISLRKSLKWKHEQEWRILMEGDIQAKAIIIKPSAIYLGCDMDYRNEEHLIKVARQKGLKIYKMIIDPAIKEYRLDIKEID